MRWIIVLSCFILGDSLQAMASPAAIPPARQYCAVPGLGITALKERPTVSVKTFGAKGDSVTDDTAAIQKAFERVQSGAILSFPEGTYPVSDILHLTRNNIVIEGHNAIIQSLVPSHQLWELKGDRIALVGMTFKGLKAERGNNGGNTRLGIFGGWIQIIGNRIEDTAGAGIVVSGAHDFRIVGNTVSGTVADGIHMTHGARRGLVEGNVVYGTGDDMISVVSYGNESSNPLIGSAGHIRIENNQVSGNTGGRGITVVGGEDVVIRNNTVSDVRDAGGILIAQEGAYTTGGVNGVLVEGNSVNRIETAPLPPGRRYPHHGAIDVNTSGQNPIEFIEIRNNKISEAGFAGIRILNQACHIRIEHNTVTGAGRQNGEAPIAIAGNSCSADTMTCTGNTAEGKDFEPAMTQCTASAPDGSAWAAIDFTAPEGSVWQGCK